MHECTYICIYRILLLIVISVVSVRTVVYVCMYVTIYVFFNECRSNRVLVPVYVCMYVCMYMQSEGEKFVLFKEEARSKMQRALDKIKELTAALATRGQDADQLVRRPSLFAYTLLYIHTYLNMQIRVCMGWSNSMNICTGCLPKRCRSQVGTASPRERADVRRR